LPCDSEDPAPTREFEELFCYCEEENLWLGIGCNSNANHMVWDNTSCNDKRGGAVGISKFFRCGDSKSR